MPLSAYTGQGASVLVVDDMESQREITSSILEQLGYRPTTVASGEAAIDFLQSHAIDLIILDMIMAPGMDGLETFKRISAFLPQQKVIIASGFAENERVEQALALGAIRYIRKPFTLETIGIAVKEALATPENPLEPTKN